MLATVHRKMILIVEGTAGGGGGGGGGQGAREVEHFAAMGNGGSTKTPPICHKHAVALAKS